MEDTSLAKLAEAHWDAVAILQEAGRASEPGKLYAVWASEIPGHPLVLRDGRLSGQKAFCSGFGLVDRALVTLGSDDGRLLDVDVQPGSTVSAGESHWQPEAFRATNTGAVIFQDSPVAADAAVGGPGFYLNRSGFWHGACGPAACWAGAAAGLLRYTAQSRRSDPHTLAHLGAIHANIWATRALLDTAGHEIDANPADRNAAHRRALTLRHLIEQLVADTLRRFGRAYGPHPLTMDSDASRRCHETEIFLRQSHGERDLEILGSLSSREQKEQAPNATR